jgi:hypothetical protein
MEINKLLLRKFFVRNKTRDGKFYDYNELPLYKIGKYIERNNKDIGFWLNQLKPDVPRTHSKENFAIPVISWVDIDFHKQQDKIEFLQDVPNPKKMMEDMKNDEGIFFFGRTLSGGIRIVGLVESFFLEVEESVYNGDSDDEGYLTKQDSIFKINNIIFAQYLEKYGIKMGRSYFDKCADKITQPTFPLKPGTMHLNLDCGSHKHYSGLEALEAFEAKQLGKFVDLTDEKLLKIATENSSGTLDLYYNQPSNIGDLFKTYSPELMSIIKYSDDTSREAWYYMMNEHYTGKSFRPFLKNLEKFNNWLDNEKSLVFTTNLYWYLKKYKII